MIYKIGLVLAACSTIALATMQDSLQKQDSTKIQEEYQKSDKLDKIIKSYDVIAHKSDSIAYIILINLVQRADNSAKQIKIIRADENILYSEKFLGRDKFLDKFVANYEKICDGEYKLFQSLNRFNEKARDNIDYFRTNKVDMDEKVLVSLDKIIQELEQTGKEINYKIIMLDELDKILINYIWDLKKESQRVIDNLYLLDELHKKIIESKPDTLQD